MDSTAFATRAWLYSKKHTYRVDLAPTGEVRQLPCACAGARRPRYTRTRDGRILFPQARVAPLAPVSYGRWSA